MGEGAAGERLAAAGDHDHDHRRRLCPVRRRGPKRPLPAAAPTRAPSQTLPRTGAGVVVLLGVSAVALFSGRTLRKTAQHIEDNLPVEALPVDDDEPTLVLGRRW